MVYQYQVWESPQSFEAFDHSAPRNPARERSCHVLTHQAGVPGLRPDTTTEQLCDWDYMCAQIAESQPWWPPGKRFGYHAQTFGFLLGETLQRVTGTSLGDLLLQTLTGPLGIGDEVHFAVPSELLPRVALQVQGGAQQAPEPGSPLSLAMPPGATPDAAFANRVDVLTSNIPSMGTMSARGVARLYAALMGHTEGFSPLSRRHLVQACEVVYTGPDVVVGVHSVSWALGYSPSRPEPSAARPGSTFGMVGTNGSAAYADIASRTAVAIMRNRFSADFAPAQKIDQIVADTYPPGPAGPDTTRSRQ